ncbi:CTD small phosphatase-like protein 3 [Anguilla rostrata]|uniref:CTD small phosphatase-like protein 3 n=1 Tax=Anguilla rostrata TaxID=7938 RepID=UPI0030CE687F
MILRSRRTPARPSKEAVVTPTSTRRSLRPRSAIRTRAASREEAVIECELQFSDEESIPTVAKRPKIPARARRRAAAAQDSEDVDFKTPVRGRQLRVHFQEDSLSPNPSTPNPAVRNIYSPIVRFLTPVKNGVQSPACGLMSPEQCVFGFDALSPLSDDETNDEVFNPYAFIKNIPSHSQQSRPCVRDIPIKTRSVPEATLVLDLDETLVFSTLSHLDNAEYTFHTSFQNHKYKVYVILRPHVQKFLQKMSKIFEMFVYTSAKRQYAEKILDVLDPQKKLFRHRLYQDDCFCVLGHYVKDLGLLQRDLAKTVVLDDAPHAFPYHVMNTLPIPSWVGDKSDRELLKLIPYLEKLSEAEDFRQVLKRRTDHLHRLLSED